jgi:DNA-binding transcriptional MerR regulator
MNRDNFSTFDVAKILGIQRSRLQEWIDAGHIEPSIQKAHGKGTRALFSKDDLYMIKLFVELLGKGFTRNRARSILGLMAGPLKDVRKADWSTDYLCFGEELRSERLRVFQERPAFSFYDRKPTLEKMKDLTFFQGVINLKVIKDFVDGRIA